MRIRVLTLATLVALAPAWAGIACAQTRANGMSAFGSSAGMNGFGSSGFGSSFGSGFGSSFGSSGFGSSAFGRGLGGSGFGQGGSQAFIGRDAGDMQAVFTQFGRASTQFFNNANRQMARANRQQRAAVTTRNPPQPLRTEVHIAFDARQPSSDAVAQSLEARLQKILLDHQMTMPDVRIENGVAVLTGIAQSDSERKVIAALVSFEPGVRSVRNEMSVAGEPTAGTSPPPGS